MIICCVILVLIVPYLKVEILTLQYGSEFSILYKSKGILNEIEYFKIMNYSKESADVYYITKGKKAGLLYKFNRDDEGVWQLENWDAVWSSSGSADSFIWPYYR